MCTRRHFFSGSYAKHTSIRLTKEDNKRDVDIIVVTTHSQDDDSSKVLQELYDVLVASSTYRSATIQHHSVGIELSQLSIDVVPVIVDKDDDSLYWIADSKDGTWTNSDPKGHKKTGQQKLIGIIITTTSPWSKSSNGGDVNTAPAESSILKE